MRKAIVQFLIIIMIVSISQMAFASDITTIYDNKIDGSNTSAFLTRMNFLVYIVQLIGLGVAIISGIILGIRYMYSAPDEKAAIKNKLIPFVIGGVLLFGAATIVGLIQDFAINIKK